MNRNILITLIAIVVIVIPFGANAMVSDIENSRSKLDGEVSPKNSLSQSSSLENQKVHDCQSPLFIRVLKGLLPEANEITDADD